MVDFFTGLPLFRIEAFNHSPDVAFLNEVLTTLRKETNYTHEITDNIIVYVGTKSCYELCILVVYLFTSDSEHIDRNDLRNHAL